MMKVTVIGDPQGKVLEKLLLLWGLSNNYLKWLKFSKKSLLSKVI
jgi:hypothetical protein